MIKPLPKDELNASLKKVHNFLFDKKGEARVDRMIEAYQAYKGRSRWKHTINLYDVIKYSKISTNYYLSLETNIDKPGN